MPLFVVKYYSFLSLICIIITFFNNKLYNIYMPEKVTICPRCGSSNIYLVLGLGDEKEISGGKCGFMGKVVE